MIKKLILTENQIKKIINERQQSADALQLSLDVFIEIRDFIRKISKDNAKENLMAVSYKSNDKVGNEYVVFHINGKSFNIESYKQDFYLAFNKSNDETYHVKSKINGEPVYNIVFGVKYEAVNYDFWVDLDKIFTKCKSDFIHEFNHMVDAIETDGNISKNYINPPYPPTRDSFDSVEDYIKAYFKAQEQFRRYKTQNAELNVMFYEVINKIYQDVLTDEILNRIGDVSTCSFKDLLNKFEKELKKRLGNGIELEPQKMKNMLGRAYTTLKILLNKQNIKCS